MAVIALALVCFACSKTTEHIGDGLLPEGDHFGVLFTDTLEILCHSEVIDSMTTKGMSAVLLGSMVDPVMGRTDANIFTQLHISSANQWFGVDPQLDSIVLQLSINGYYGDTTTWQTLHVYELADSLSVTETYYHFSEVPSQPVDLANSYQFRPHPQTKFHVVGNDTLEHAIIRVRLDDNFGNKLIHADTSHYKSPAAFKRFMYGLKISCDPVGQDGAITYLNPTHNDVTMVQIYYHESPEAQSRMRYNFYITTEDAYFNQYLHDYSLGSPEFCQQLLQGDVQLGQQKLYLQSMSGVRSVLQFPNLSHWTDSLEHAHLIINEAKLIIPASLDDADNTLTPPSSLALLNVVDENGNTALLKDYYEGTSYYGGTYSSQNRSVVFRIGEHLQSVMMGKQETYGIYLSILGAAFNAQRWVIAGPESEQDNRLRCEIKYSIVSE